MCFVMSMRNSTFFVIFIRFATKSPKKELQILFYSSFTLFYLLEHSLQIFLYVSITTKTLVDEHIGVLDFFLT